MAARPVAPDHDRRRRADRGRRGADVRRAVRAAGRPTAPTICLMGGGAALTFFGVALLSPRLVRPLAAAIGAPIERLTGITGRLARENAMRQPGRTAVTAAALMIGVALVTFASIFAAGARDDDRQGGRRQPQGPARRPEHRRLLVVLARGAADRRARRRRARDVSARALLAVARGPGVKGKTAVSGIDPRTLPDVYKLQVDRGRPRASSRACRARRRWSGKDFADEHDTKVGETLAVTTPSGRPARSRASSASSTTRAA